MIEAWKWGSLLKWVDEDLEGSVNGGKLVSYSLCFMLSEIDVEEKASF